MDVTSTISPIDTHYTFGLGPRDPWPTGTNSTNAAWRFRRRLNVQALASAAAEVAGRHAILRCALRYLEGGWRFVADEAPRFQLYELDASVDPKKSEALAVELLQEVIWRPFDIEAEAPFRVACVKIAADNYLVGFVIHKAFAEGESVRIFAYELASLYDAIAGNRASALEKLPIQYADYMRSMQQWSEGPQSREAFAYWSKYLEGASGLKHSRSQHQCVQVAVPRELSDAVREVGRQQEIRPHVLWEAIHHITLSLACGRSDITTLTVTKGRKQLELQGLIGSFVNLLPNRSRISSQSTFLEVLHGINEVRRESARHASTPCNLMAQRCALRFSDLPHFNWLTSSMMPRGWFRSDFTSHDSDQMVACLSTRIFLASPEEAPQSSIDPVPANPYLYAPYVLFVVDGSEFTIVCLGDIGVPFTPSSLAHRLERVAKEVATDPNCSVGSLIERDFGRG